MSLQPDQQKKPEEKALRLYQRQSVAKAAEQNTIVMLPTGAGKTRVGAEVIRQIGWPSIFIVPKTFLVSQQAKAIRDHFQSAEADQSMRPMVSELTGGKALTAFGVLVCTPAALINAETSIQWTKIRCIVFDECHHARKDDPYAKVAQLIVEKKIFPRVVGLTALMAYNTEERKIYEECSDLCQLLRIECIVKFQSEQLVSEGFTGHKSRTDEVHCYDDSLVPQRPTDQPWRSLLSDVLSDDLAKSTAEERAIVQTTLFIESCLDDALSEDKRLFQDVCPDVVDTLGRPVSTFAELREMVPLAEWGKCAYNCYEQLKSQPNTYLQAGVSADKAIDLARGLPYWYEAFRIAAVSDPDGSDIAAVFLRMVQVTKELDVSRLLPLIQASPRALTFHQATIDYLPRMLDDKADVESNESFRLHHLRQCLLKCLRKSKEESKEFQGIVFVEHRVTAHVLDWWINTHLSPALGGIKSTALFAVKSPATFNIRITKEDMKARLESFREGDVRLLVTTTVAEEGMDVPDANHVIRFDRVKNAVSQVQGKGRAREEGSKHIHLANDQQEVDLQGLAVSRNEFFANDFNLRRPKDGYYSSLQREIMEHLAKEPRRSTHQPPGIAATGKNPISMINEWIAKRKGYTLLESWSSGNDFFRMTVQLMSSVKGVVFTATGAPCRSKQDSKLSAYEQLWSFIESGNEQPQPRPQLPQAMPPSSTGSTLECNTVAPARSTSASTFASTAGPAVSVQSGPLKNGVTLVKEWMDRRPGYKLEDSYDNQVAPPFTCTLKLIRIADTAVVAEASSPTPKQRKQDAKAAAADALLVTPFFASR